MLFFSKDTILRTHQQQAVDVSSVGVGPLPRQHDSENLPQNETSFGKSATCACGAHLQGCCAALRPRQPPCVIALRLSCSVSDDISISVPCLSPVAPKTSPAPLTTASQHAVAADVVQSPDLQKLSCGPLHRRERASRSIAAPLAAAATTDGFIAALDA